MIRSSEPAASDSKPTVDEMSEWSFPASDPPAVWTWDVEQADPAGPAEPAPDDE